MKALAEARSAVRRLGWLDGTVYVAARAVARLTAGRAALHKYYFVAQRVAGRPLLARAPGTLDVRRVGRDDPVVAAFPRPADVIRRRFDAGAVCFVATSGGRFAGFLWLQFDRYEEDEVRCVYLTTPAGRTAWDYDVYVEPPFRMGRAFLRLWDAAFEELRAHGAAWTFSRIHAANRASLRAHARFVTERVGSALFLCAGRVQLALLSMPPYLHASASGHGPVLRFAAPDDGRPGGADG